MTQHPLHAQGDHAREENSNQDFDLTAKEAKFTKKENISEPFPRFVPN